jgi:hypothetical protein
MIKDVFSIKMASIIQTEMAVYGQTSIISFFIQAKIQFKVSIFSKQKRTIENYKNKAQCIVNQYSSYIVKQIQMNVSSRS